MTSKYFSNSFAKF